ncbi:hypothetical protein BDK51DRAFT_34215, partial [Blyttiomyces helicus]
KTREEGALTEWGRNTSSIATNDLSSGFRFAAPLHLLQDNHLLFKWVLVQLMVDGEGAAEDWERWDERDMAGEETYGTGATIWLNENGAGPSHAPRDNQAAPVGRHQHERPPQLDRRETTACGRKSYGGFDRPTESEAGGMRMGLPTMVGTRCEVINGRKGGMKRNKLYFARSSRMILRLRCEMQQQLMSSMRRDGGKEAKQYAGELQPSMAFRRNRTTDSIESTESEAGRKWMELPTL